MTSAPQPLVRIHNLEVAFQAGAKTVHALNGVNLEVGRGEAVALIGESGSGKSVTLRALMRLHPPRRTRIRGEMQVDGRDVLAMNSRELADMRGPVVSMVFQEPLLALDPVYTVGRQIEEMVRRHTGKTAAEARAQALSLFERVRIPSPERRLQAYPHEMSGGMRQRAMIALALSCNPKVLLADEPTTALDATVQIQILLLLRELQRELGLSIVFVTHDIGAAAEIADRVAVMYGGRIVEQGTVADLLRAPRHPYTLALLKGRAHGAMRKGQRLETIPGSPPDLAALPPGCSFAPRCSLAQPRCQAAVPDIEPVAPGHEVRCIRVAETQ
ncbi:dipeptide ABC transporter ATP-binding protein DppD [Achromobacter marplatensis]|uniref:Peptide/nickel transport system ATP-binding protein n=1 Tax=Achromobacter marplatensis TaxID=470868 RepID=A0ABX9GAG9_9BURK|nr:ABC transporter ATP-binding protein [Achromobacter marplatensis]OWT67457.1 dipeptide ABC transporter ATP-binding protein DppD [Achromobacter marplatensis]RBP20103.1 peptide/nickel transport system ATP-binding protein [Achromobacter marplatensis]CAB3634560.1 Oligopeptide transport ATP-binding protein OppD [Achromobacter marplatensis]